MGRSITMQSFMHLLSAETFGGQVQGKASPFECRLPGF